MSIDERASERASVQDTQDVTDGYHNKVATTTTTTTMPQTLTQVRSRQVVTSGDDPAL